MATHHRYAPFSFIRRASILAQRQSRPARLSTHSHATRQYSYATETVSPMHISIERGNNSIFHRPTTHLSNATTNTALGRPRTMVMVTQTKSSEQDDEQNNNSNTSTQPSGDDAPIEAAYDENHIVITASCAARIRQLASTRPNPDSIYLRLYVDAGGCSGFQYKFLLLSEDNDGSNSSGDDDDEEEDGTIDPEEDIVFIKDEMRVVVDQTSLDLLRGSTIDYVQEMIRSSFAVVGNPQSESACGCGSSFAVKNFEANPALD